MSAVWVSGGVAALAIIASLLTTRMTLRHQRELARSERLAACRADAYIRLIEHQRVDPAFQHLLPPEVASRVIAYGTEDVNSLLQRVRDATGGSPADFGKVIDALAARIRYELQGTEDEAPLRVTTRWQAQD